MNKFKEILNNIDSDVFTPEVQDKLVQIVQEKIETAEAAAFEKGVERGICTLDEKLEELNNDHAEKLQQVIEKLTSDKEAELEDLNEANDNEAVAKTQEMLARLDEEATEKTQAIVEAIIEDHTEKLQTVKEFYETKYEEQIVEKINDYLETYVEELIPESQTIDYIRLQMLEETFNKAKKIFGATDEFMQGEVRVALDEAKEEMDKKDDKIENLIAEKVELSVRIKRYEAEKMLEEKTADMTDGEAAYVRKFLEGCDVEEIKTRLDEAVAAYKADEEAERQEIIEEDISNEVEVPSMNNDETLINESVNTDDVLDNGAPVNVYVKNYKKSLK